MRNIFVLIDGTMCSGDTGTNVALIDDALIKNNGTDECYYVEGIAANSSMKWFQTAIPTEINNEAYSIYKTLCMMKVDLSDRLIILGYSRGAIVARILAQMITNQVARRDVLGSSARARYVLKKKTVEFLGLYDPVRGRPYPFKMRGYDASVHNNSSVLNLFEIVSIDEGFLLFSSDSAISKRTRPTPDYKILKRLSRKSITTFDVVESDREMTAPPKRHYCLFPGVHSDVGGHTSDVALGSVATLAMIGEIVRAIPTLRSSFESDKIDSLKDSIQSHPDIVIGSRIGLLRRYLRSRRKFRINAETTVHPLVDDLIGRRGINRSIPFYRFRKYSLKEEVKNWTRSVFVDL